MAKLLISDDDLDALLDAANPVELASLNTVAVTRALVELREASLTSADPQDCKQLVSAEARRSLACCLQRRVLIGGPFAGVRP